MCEMTVDEAIKYLTPIAESASLPNYVTALTMAVSALRAKQEDEKNDPLTLEELRQIDGQPVWVTSTNNGRGRSWALVDRKYEVCREVHGGLAVFERYGKTWLAYRRPPGELAR